MPGPVIPERVHPWGGVPARAAAAGMCHNNIHEPFWGLFDLLPFADLVQGDQLALT